MVEGQSGQGYVERERAATPTPMKRQFWKGRVVPAVVGLTLQVPVLLVAPLSCNEERAVSSRLAPHGAVASVAVLLAAPRILVGQQTTAEAVALDRYGAVIPDEFDVAWTVSNAAVATVSKEGVLTAATAGSTVVTAQVDSISGAASLLVESPGSQGSGPPALPRILLDFPFPEVTGQTIRVNAGDNLQKALDRAQRGDEVVLAAAGHWSGNFTLPVKPGTAANGWITVRTDRLADLPALGSRVAPDDSSIMPTIETPNSNPAIRTEAGASGWRLVGLEVTVSPALTGQNYGLVFLGDGSRAQNSLATVPSNIVLDRMYIHGRSNTQLSRCVALNSASSEVSGSWLDECHGKGFDSQAIWGGNGPGPFRIVNNTLQGAGENIMFGGSDPAIPGLIPSDIEIRGNYIYTPVSWKGVWTKKNLLELKNASRVLIEGNVFDGSWLDAQTGWAIILKSANQGGSCRWCRTTDVTLRRNLIRNTGAGINIAAKGDNPATDTTARRILIQENVLEGIGVGAYPGDQRGFQLLAGTQDITLERNVLAGNLDAALVLDRRPGSANATFSGNVWAYGRYGTIATGMSSGAASLGQGAPSALWTQMVFIGPPKGGYPPGTTFVSSEAQSPLALQIRTAVINATNGVTPS